MTTATHLTTAECWELLEHETLGRLALIGRDNVPDVFPVNYVSHEGAIYMRTAHDSKLVRIAEHPVAGFEVDSGEGDELWSVVVRGSIARLTDEAEIERVGVNKLSSWSPRHKPFVLKLTGHVVTGRKFAKTDGRREPRPLSRATPVPPAPTEASGDGLLKPPSLPPLASPYN